MVSGLLSSKGAGGYSADSWNDTAGVGSVLMTFVDKVVLNEKKNINTPYVFPNISTVPFHLVMLSLFNFI